MALGRPFDGFVEQTTRVSPTCLIHFERNRYSMPASFANRPVSLRIYPERIVIAAEGQILCEHVRIIERSHHLLGRTIPKLRRSCGFLSCKSLTRKRFARAAPSIPAECRYNNGAENNIRCEVTRRKISGTTRSDNGRDCRDTSLSRIKTCQKLNILFWDYLGERLGLSQDSVPNLADLVAART
jgi:hypothetical protein